MPANTRWEQQKNNQSTQIETAWQTRKTSQLSSLITDQVDQADFLVIGSPCDMGVIRNGGRNGARFAPQAIINCFKKMTISHHLQDSQIAVVTTPESILNKYRQDFIQAQIEESQFIDSILGQFTGKAIFHLGGGHDHIYPLLKGLKKTVGIINIDAHLDTRTDQLPHSGTPFRQYIDQLKEAEKKNVDLLQVGIHSFANACENYQNMNPFMTELTVKDFLNLPSLSTRPGESKNQTWLLSLDCDGLDSSLMEAVSAVNHQGISALEWQKIKDKYLTQINQRPAIIGIYEYNPIYDNLSQKAARFLAAQMYQVCEYYSQNEKVGAN